MGKLIEEAGEHMTSSDPNCPCGREGYGSDVYCISCMEDLPCMISRLVEALKTALSEKPEISSMQHCTALDCASSGISHTAAWCNTKQPRRCGCPFCYPDVRNQ